MDLLIVDTLEPEVADWLAARHAVRHAPELVRDAAALRRSLALARAAIVPANLPVDASLLRQAPELRAVGRIGPAPDQVDADACAQAGVEVVRSPLASALAEAEFVVGALLQLLRRLPVAAGNGSTRGYRSVRELGGCTVGIVGLTPTARGLVQMLGGFGCRVVGYDPGVHANDAVWARWAVTPVGLAELLATADAVCVLLPYYTRYRGLLGDRLLPHCKSSQVIVCTSPGALFDDAALARALDHGVIAGAWLDQAEPGSTDAGRPLADARNLVVTPRLAAGTRDALLRSAWTVARRIDEVLAALRAAAGAAAAVAASAAVAPPPAAPTGALSPAEPAAVAGLAAGPAAR